MQNNSKEDYDKYTAKVAVTNPTSVVNFKAKDVKEYEEMLLDFVRKQFEEI